MKNKLIALLLLFASSVAIAKIQNEDVKSLSDITSAVLTTTGNLTISTACIASPASVAGLAPGQFIYDTTHSSYISTGTTIVGLPGTCSAGQIQMSTNAVNSATGDAITFGGTMSQLINTSKIYDSTYSEQLSTWIAAQFPLPAPMPSPSPSGRFIITTGTGYATVGNPGVLPSPSPSGAALTANGSNWNASGGGILTNASGGWHIESAQISNSGTSAIVQQSGTWLTGSNTISTGSVTLTIGAGIFSGTPNCVASGQITTIGNGYCNVAGGASSTNAGVNCWDGSSTLANQNFNIICMGPR